MLLLLFYWMLVYFDVPSIMYTNLMLQHLPSLLQIFVRQKNRSSSKAPENPIKVSILFYNLMEYWPISHFCNLHFFILIVLLIFQSHLEQVIQFILLFQGSERILLIIYLKHELEGSFVYNSYKFKNQLAFFREDSWKDSIVKFV